MLFRCALIYTEYKQDTTTFVPHQFQSSLINSEISIAVPQRDSHLFEVTKGVFGPVDVAHHPAGELVRVGVVVLREGQEQGQDPDHSHHHLGFCGRHTLL